MIHNCFRRLKFAHFRQVSFDHLRRDNCVLGQLHLSAIGNCKSLHSTLRLFILQVALRWRFDMSDTLTFGIRTCHAIFQSEDVGAVYVFVLVLGVGGIGVRVRYGSGITYRRASKSRRYSCGCRRCEGGSLSIQHVCCSTWTVVENAILSVALALRKQSAVFVHLLAWACVLLEFDTFLLNEEGVVPLACLARLGSVEQIVRASEVQ